MFESEKEELNDLRRDMEARALSSSGMGAAPSAARLRRLIELEGKERDSRMRCAGCGSYGDEQDGPCSESQDGCHRSIEVDAEGFAVERGRP